MQKSNQPKYLRRRGHTVKEKIRGLTRVTGPFWESDEKKKEKGRKQRKGKGRRGEARISSWEKN